MSRGGAAPFLLSAVAVVGGLAALVLMGAISDPPAASQPKSRSSQKKGRRQQTLSVTPLGWVGGQIALERALSLTRQKKVQRGSK